jgi:hypothetical protein
MSTGPRTSAGKLKSLAAIGQKPRDKSWPSHPPELLERIRCTEKERVKSLEAIAHARVMGNGG